MAVKHDGEYYRITNISVDYNLNTVVIGVRMYSADCERLLELSAESKYPSFSSQAHAYLGKSSSEIEDYISSRKIGNDEELELALKGDEEFSKKYNRHKEICSELSKLEASLLKENINIDGLKFKELWKECGLVQDLWKAPNITGYKNYRFALKGENITREEAYTELKKILGNCEDC